MTPLYRVVAAEAENRGLDCIPEGYGARHVFVGGHRCQIVSSKTWQGGKFRQHTGVPLYLPRPRWADFLIYVVRYLEGQAEPSFFIVPRDKICRESGVSSIESWLFEYKDAWAPLRTPPAPLDESKKSFEKLNWKMAHVVAQAHTFGYRVERIPRNRRDHEKQFIKNRVLINGLKCQVMAAPRMSKDPENEFWNGIHLYASKQTWADFVIYIVKPGDERITFIIPRKALPHSTTTFIETDWLKIYRENWSWLERPEIVTELDSVVQAQLEAKRAMREAREEAEHNMREAARTEAASAQDPRRI